MASASTFYDNPYWEYHLPVSPPIQPGKDIDPMTGELYSWNGPDRVGIDNWLVKGEYTFQPRLRDNVQEKRSRWRAVDDDDF